MEKRASALGYLRKKAKLTQQKVADEIGVDQTAISQWETGRTAPGTDKLRALAKLYGCTIDDLFTTAEEP